MKRTGTLALIAFALAYLLGLQFVRYERAVAHEKSGVPAVAMPRPAPGKPAARSVGADRHVLFGGYPCRGNDCSDDWAGYRWAEANRIADPDDCTGKTASFIEGCRVYARQRTR